MTKWLLNVDMGHRQIHYRYGHTLGIGRSIIFQTSFQKLAAFMSLAPSVSPDCAESQVRYETA